MCACLFYKNFAQKCESVRTLIPVGLRGTFDTLFRIKEIPWQQRKPERNIVESTIIGNEKLLANHDIHKSKRIHPEGDCQVVSYDFKRTRMRYAEGNHHGLETGITESTK